MSSNFAAVATAMWVEGRGREVKVWWEMRKSAGAFTSLSFKKFVSETKRGGPGFGETLQTRGKEVFCLGCRVFQHVSRPK